MNLRLVFAMMLLGVSATWVFAQEDLNDQLERMTREAIRKVAPSVVQIATQGGADVVAVNSKGQVFRKALGPTTGVVVSPDGYIISSAFNFFNDPTTILVTVPGRKDAYVAKKVATDKSRMLTLLKIDAKDLVVPQSVPRKEIAVGHWSLAVGRSLDVKRDSLPSVSVGIISALGRIWGKAIQTDAKISPLNYGGPITDIEGKVQGILIPASPQGEDVTAGFEWYDSGIGFAIPFEDVLAALPRLKEGKDLSRGLLGVAMKSKDIYADAPEIGMILPESAAAKAGLKVGDVITAIDGKPVVRMAQISHLLGPKYDGDTIHLKYRRGTEEKEIQGLRLVAELKVAGQPYLGILPMRDDPKLGVEIRHVFPGSPAERAGLKEGDRIMKIEVGKTMVPFSGQKPSRVALQEFLSGQAIASDLKMEVVRKGGGKTETVSATLDALPGSTAKSDWKFPDAFPQPATLKKAREPLEAGMAKGVKGFEPKKDPAEKEPAKQEAGKIETGLMQRNTPDGEHKYYVYLDDDYDPNVSHGVVVWLHPPGRNKKEDFEEFQEAWAGLCKIHNLILVMPVSENPSGWIAGESDAVVTSLRETLSRYTVDRQRVVTHGMGVGGQMAIYLGFQNRDLIRGVATMGAVPTTVKDNVPGGRLSFFLAAGALDPLVKNIQESRTKLTDKKYSAIFREVPNRGREYLDETTQRDLVRWIDALDRL